MTMTERTPQAIPTVFQGIPMRSRLEAKAAMFMTLLGVKYDYEPDGYSLFGGGESPAVGYCPDFFLPDLDCYLEIKPNPQALGDMWNHTYGIAADGSTFYDGDFNYSSGFMKAEGLAFQTMKNVYVAFGFPWSNIWGWGPDPQYTGDVLAVSPDEKVAFGFHDQARRYCFSLPERWPGCGWDRVPMDPTSIIRTDQMHLAEQAVLAHQFWVPRRA